MRVVLDTNIFISSVLGGALKEILDSWKAGKYTLVVSDAIAHEYLDVIRRPKFKIEWQEVVSVTDYLLQLAEFVTPTEQVLVIVADSTDNKFLEAAIAGKVDFIVSGDKHLLNLKEFRSIPIITGREFLDWLEANG
jgi:putative PIN family toxin of toxin-antitoxin system